MHVYFCRVCFLFLVLNQEIGLGGKNVFEMTILCRVGSKTLVNHIVLAIS